MYWDNPQFFGVRARAANIRRSVGNYTVEMFQADFPQFFKKETAENEAGEEEPIYVSLVPLPMLEMIVAEANSVIQPEVWLDGWRYAAGLYVAHYATLYLRTYAESSDTPGQAAATGALVGVVSSATLGDSSVSYDTDALTKATAEWGDLNATQYGQILASRAKRIGLGGTYVI